MKVNVQAIVMDLSAEEQAELMDALKEETDEEPGQKDGPSKNLDFQ